MPIKQNHFILKIILNIDSKAYCTLQSSCSKVIGKVVLVSTVDIHCLSAGSETLYYINGTGTNQN